MSLAAGLVAAIFFHGGRMKPATTLKNVLKPPFFSAVPGKGYGEICCKVNQADYGHNRFLQIRGWGFFQYYENGAELQDEFEEWVVKALNNQAERDFCDSP